MSIAAVPGYTDVFGKHGAWIGDHTGPKSYNAFTAPNTGGQTLSATYYGLRSIHTVLPMGYTESGKYAVKSKLSSVGGAAVQTAILVWFAVTYSVGVEVLTEVAADTDLSGETIRLLIIGD
jgi:hypothetical protein